ncbi:hypothetical protein B0O99DRAFT_530852 [Bisporella sp. PMI_857]|nr:hypothetical protein B0O99DRAFT_530852 [Bisporella sp. PMI_857]
MFPINLRPSTAAEAGLQAGTLALVTLIPLLAGAHHAFLADLLGVSLRTIRLVHRSAGIVTCLLCPLHILIAVASKASLPLGNPQNLSAVIAALSLALLLLLACRIFRKFSYEIFLRVHQALSALLTYAVWRHLPSDRRFPRGYIYISAGLYLATSILQVGSIIFYNGILRYYRSRATLTHDHGAVKVSIQLQKQLEFDAGKYINLWTPSVGFWAFLQSHPFMVISWAPGKQHTIDLLIDPQSGLTRDLLYHAKQNHAINLLTMFSGPHGTSVAMDEYGSILMVASGFGIAAHLSYLKRLIYGYNARRTRARRIHLVWQIRHKTDAAVAQSLLNDALQDDKLDDGCILSISIYLESNDILTFPFGKRATVYPGTAPLSEIFLDEVLGKYIKKPAVEGAQKDVMALDSEKPMPEEKDIELGACKVSGYNDVRDQLRDLTRDYLEEGVELVELDYQPQ